MKFFLTLLASLFSCLMLTGCWDRKEINDIAFVLATGIDKESNQYRVSLQIALPGQMGESGSTTGGGGGTGGNKSWLLNTAAGKSIREANELQQLTISRHLYFSHRRVVLLGESVARSGIEPILDLLSSVPQNRMSAFVLVTKDTTKNVLSAQTQLERFPAEKIRKLTDTWLSNPPNIKQVTDVLGSHGLDLMLPVVSVAQTSTGYMGKPEGYIKIDGIAVFQHDKLAGFLQGDQAKGVLLASNKLNHPTITFRAPHSKGTLTIQLRTNRAELKPRTQNQKVAMAVNFYAKAYVLGNQSNMDLTSEDLLPTLEEAANQVAKQEIEDGIRTLQNKFHSDALGFGDAIYRGNPKTWIQLETNWEQLYPKIPVQVNSFIHIQQTGIVTAPLSDKEEELKK